MNKATHKLVTINGDEYEVYLRDIECKEWYCPSVGSRVQPNVIREITPLPIEPEEPETFDWKEAMRLFADGVGVQIKGENLWLPIEIKEGVLFLENKLYRRAPKAPPAPKVTEYYANWYYSPRENTYCLGSVCYSLKEVKQQEKLILIGYHTLAHLKFTVTEGVKKPTVEVIEV